jgi:hypothetical protein
MAWTEAHDARHIFWLNGFAGSGKSTIARTVAHQCAVEQLLGASFFFTRGGGDLASARKFVTTVAVQLAAAVPALKPHICHAASAVRNVAALAPQDQWARLVLEPLAKLSVDGGGEGEGGSGRWRRRRRPINKPLVLVIDALNECHLESETAAILGLSPRPHLALVPRQQRSSAVSTQLKLGHYCHPFVTLISIGKP